MRLADRTHGLMDGTMDSEAKGRTREQSRWRRGKNSSPFPGKLNLRLGCGTLLCLSSYRALRCGSQPVSLLALHPSLHSLTFCFSLPLFVLFIPSFLSPPPLLLLALTYFAVFLPPLFLLAFSPSSLFRHGRVAGPDQSLWVSIAILCVLMSLVLTMCC